MIQQIYLAEKLENHVWSPSHIIQGILLRFFERVHFEPRVYQISLQEFDKELPKRSLPKININNKDNQGKEPIQYLQDSLWYSLKLSEAWRLDSLTSETNCCKIWVQWISENLLKKGIKSGDRDDREQL